jgi:hypothetical protein
MNHLNPRAAIGARTWAAAQATLLAGAAIIVLATCTNPLRATIIKATSDYQIASTAVLAGGAPIQNGYGVDKAASIVFQFSQSMGPSMVSVSGDFANESKPPAWSARKVSQDTLTLAPSSGAWSPGSQKTLTLQFVSGSTKTAALSFELGVLDAAVYVSTTGSDNNPGTADRPKLTIPAAIANAALYYGPSKPAQVRVAQGTYQVKYTLGTHIVMKPGISILGSYAPDWSRPTFDTTSLTPTPAPTSTITDTSIGKTSGTARPVDCGSGLSTDTLLDGFVIQGGGSATTSGSVAIYCSSSGPTISNVVASGGFGTSSAGFYVVSGTPLVTNCALDGGGGGTGTDSVGVITENCGSGCVIRTSTITGGQGGNSCTGIENEGDQPGLSAPTIIGNSITGATGSPGPYLSTGIDNITSNALIVANYIRAGTFFSNSAKNGAGTGISIQSGSNVIVRNNVIVGGEIKGNGPEYASSIGIAMTGQGAIVQNNTICGGLASGLYNSCTGIYLGQGTDPNSTTIENNIIFTLGGLTEYSVAQEGSGLNASTFAYNLLFNCANGVDLANLYSIETSPGVFQNFSSIGLLDADHVYSAWASNNISASSPLSVFNALTGASTGTSVGADWSLLSNSPAKGAGIDLSSPGFSTDITGTARTDPWSIGAYQ